MDKNKKLVEANFERNVALCYVRQSQTRNNKDVNNLERQKANIKIVCEKRGWTPEWYEDTGSQIAVAQESNCPSWLALKQRLGDSDVAALVVNDLSRLDRTAWGIGNIVELVAGYNIKLVTAASDREIDFSTTVNRFFALLMGVFDEFYSNELATEAK